MYRVEHAPLGQEAHLGLGGVDVHVHRLHGKLDLQHAGREPTGHDLVFIGLLHGGAQRARLDEAAVDEEILEAAVAARRGRLCDEAADGNFLPSALDRDHVVHELPPEDLIDRGPAVAVAGGVQLFGAVLEEAEGDLRVRQRLALDGGKDGGGLRHVGLHEFHARGRVVEQVAHQNGRSVRAAGRLFGADDARLQIERRSGGTFARFGQQIDLRDRRNGRQRFAAEAQRPDGREVVLCAQLAGRMAQECDARVGRLHAAAVVGDADEGHAAVADLDRNGRRARVDRVFDQLLDGGGRTLHDLARGDQVGDMRVKLLDLRHGSTSVSTAPLSGA